MKEIKLSCLNLLKDCQNSAVYHSHSRLDENQAIAELRKKISTSKMANKISPQEEEENNRIVQKMRKKYHKKHKESSIKKTDLGQDLLTFTKQQFQKLQFIDQCQQKNIIYRENLEPLDEANAQRLTAVDRLKKMAKVDDIIDEIKLNLTWGDMKQNQQKKYYFKLKQSKGFLQRGGQHPCAIVKNLGRQRKEEKLINEKSSLQKYYRTLLNKESFNKNFMNSYPSWNRQSPIPLSFADKVEMVKEEANRSLMKMYSNKSAYMTEQRRNALYECQILRLSKKILGRKEFQNLLFSIKPKENSIQKQETSGDFSIENDTNNCQAEQILQKNHRRIKEQRNRVIQKLLC